MATFAQVFMRIYDRKIASGEITFSRSGIQAGDFTRLCVDGEFVIPKDRLQVICEKMKLTDEERQQLMAFAEEAEKR